jgi:threonine 3-dehydrogenase
MANTVSCAPGSPAPVTGSNTRPPVAAGKPASGLMRALVKARAAEGLDFTSDRPLPLSASQPDLPRGEPGPGEVLIRVKKAGVCGTDRHIFEWDEWAKSRIPVGIVTGHEFVGTVEKLGAGVTNCHVGQRVSAEGHITSFNDYNSRTGNAHIASDTRILGVDRDGCFAELLIIPASNVWPMHEAIPDKFAAIMDPLGNAVHTVMSAGVSTKSVLITGVGIIGLMAVTVARAAGAARIYATDTNPRRLDLARKLGAAEVFNPLTDKAWIERIKRETRGDGVDVLLEMSGSPAATDQGFSALRNGGTAALLGIPSKPFAFDLTNHVVFKGAKVLGINGRKMWETWYQMENLLVSGRLELDDIVTHELPMERADEAFRLMQSGEGIKIVLNVG